MISPNEERGRRIREALKKKKKSLILKGKSYSLYLEKENASGLLKEEWKEKVSFWIFKIFFFYLLHTRFTFINLLLI